MRILGQRGSSMKNDGSRDIKVSVIIPVYKVDKYLKQCLESVVNQTLRELEIIIVDEGDMDRCREIIDEFERNDPRIIAPHQKNGGYGASCNLGLDMARGEYVAIVESDDFLEPSAYEEMYAYASSLGADVVKTPYYKFYSDGDRYDCPYRTYLKAHLPQGRTFSAKEFGHLLGVHASVWSALYKRTYMEENRIRFVEARGAAYVDVGFRIDTLIHTDQIAYLDKPFYNYRIDNGNSSTNNFSMKQMIQRWKEAHEKFGADNDDYDSFYGPFLIFDEYLNSVAWLDRIEITEEEQKGMLRNLGFVKEKVIKGSPILTKKQKNELINFKLDSKKYLEGKAWNRRLGKIYFLIDKNLKFLSARYIMAAFGIGAAGMTLLRILGLVREKLSFMLWKYGIFLLAIFIIGKALKLVLRKLRIWRSTMNYAAS